MKILSARQIRELDNYTIKHEPIDSINLMERASLTFVKWFSSKFGASNHQIAIFCGIGNNGGDGLAIARLLHHQFYNVEVYFCKISETFSPDCLANLKALPSKKELPFIEINSDKEFPNIAPSTIIVDAIFGSGLNRAISGYWGELIEYLNLQNQIRIAVDIPSGLFADQSSNGIAFKADYCLSFEFPKLAFLFPQNAKYLKNWEFRSIGLHKTFIENSKTSNYYITEKWIKSLVQKRLKFAHKGNYGHALLIAGSLGKTGAASLAAQACLRSGAGLLSVHVPRSSYSIMQISIPEAMTSLDDNDNIFSQKPELTPYSTIGIGPGLGTSPLTMKAFEQVLDEFKAPMLIDADALNLLALNPSLQHKIPKGSILTPHPGEFKRLFGDYKDDFERNEVLRNKAQSLNCIILLKGANTCIASPDRNCYFNSTGNPGMATAGSGDVLSGIITGLLAQNYSSLDAALIGVYLHGLAGDLAADKHSESALIAGDIISEIGNAYLELL